jgi:hypothetical protein
MTGHDDPPRPAPGTDRRASGDDGSGRRLGHDRGVSEVLAFVLVFGIIVTSVGIIFTFGFPQLQDLRDTEQDQNAEATFVEVARKFDDLRRGDAVRRSGELSVEQASLRVTDDTTVDVTVDNSSTTVASDSFQVGALSYFLEGTTVAYENGAIVRSSDEAGTSVLVGEPRFDCGPDRAYVSLTTVRLAGDATAVGTSVVTVVGERNRSQVVYPTARRGAGSASDATSVTLRVTSPRQEAWDRYLDRRGDWSSDGSGGYRCTTDAVYVRHTVLAVQVLA